MPPPRTQRRSISPPPPISTPALVGGNFSVTISKPSGRDLSGPALGYLGVYTIAYHLKMDISFRGTVNLPPGTWEIGLIQNLFNHTHRRQYSQGGFAFFSMDPPAGGLLDSGQGQSDIWYDPPDGSRRITLRTPTRVTFALQGEDMPADFSDIPAEGKRCNGKFSEQLLWIYNSLRFRAVLAVRTGGSSGTVMPLAISDPYGCEYMFEVPSGGGQPSDDWLTFKEILPKKTHITGELSLSLQFLRLAMSPSSTRANTYGTRFDPKRDYLTNCNEYLGPYTPERMGITGF